MIKKSAYNPLTSPNEDTDVLTDVLTEETIGFNLIVWNDEVNSFEWVM
jgi:hypothetical protein